MKNRTFGVPSNVLFSKFVLFLETFQNALLFVTDPSGHRIGEVFGRPLENGLFIRVPIDFREGFDILAKGALQWGSSTKHVGLSRSRRSRNTRFHMGVKMHARTRQAPSFRV